VEPLFISLKLKEYYVASKNAVFWDAFTAVTRTNVFWEFHGNTILESYHPEDGGNITDAFWDFIPVTLFRTNISQSVSSPSSRDYRVIGFRSCITVKTFLLSLSIEGYY
jgi:hypothetical protein